jgi:GT2 family glycosyltransferase
MENKHKLLVIIITYNGEHWIDYCLQDLISKGTSNGFDTLCIDNSSKDNTVTKLKENYPSVKIFEQSVNLGFGKACNIGMTHAIELGYDFVFLLNQDAQIDFKSIESLVDIYQRNPEYGIISPIQLEGNRSQLDQNFGHYLRPYNTPKLMDHLILNQPISEIYNTKFVNAAAWLISTKSIKEVGMFDPVFPHYGEDDDLARRYIIKGYKIGVAPKVYAYHKREERSVEASNHNFQSTVNREYVSLILLFYKYPSSRAKKYLYIFRYILSQVITNFIMFDFSKVVIQIRAFKRFVLSAKKLK